jgi:hypothetical protein
MNGRLDGIELSLQNIFNIYQPAVSMSRKYHWISITVFLAAVFSFCISRDIRIEKQYTTDLRNRIIGARLQKDGRTPYFYQWRPVDGLRYFDPVQTDTVYANAITASPFFHHLLFPIADLPQRQISRIWLVWEYLTFLSIVLFAFAFTKSINQQWAVAITAVLLLFMNAWQIHISAGQFYIIIPLFAFVFLFCIIRKKQLFFLLLAGLAASVLILIRPTCIIFFFPFLFLLKTFKVKEYILFFLPALLLFGYSILNTKERGCWLEYRKAIAAHIKIHQIYDPRTANRVYEPFMYNNWEGWDTNSIRKAKIAFPFFWHSESSSIGVFSKDALQIIIPVWVIHMISFVSISILLFFWIRPNNKLKSNIVYVAIFGFCLYLISDFLSPILRSQYYGVQWAFPLLLLAAFYDKRLRLVYLLLLAGLLLNITNTPYLKMRHTIGELIILFTLLWLCLSPKSPLIR